VTRRIEIGERIFLLRQGEEPKGIIGSGVTLSTPFEESHFDSKRAADTAWYIKVRLDVLLDPIEEPILSRSALSSKNLLNVHWDTPASGNSIPPEAASELEELWATFLREHGLLGITLAEEVQPTAAFWEGATKRISINAYERDNHARKACIQHHGALCAACGFEFSKFYGTFGDGYIHVHHLVPLSSIGKSYVVDPIKDLRPICPNCHAMIHRQKVPLSIEELRRIILRR